MFIDFFLQKLVELVFKGTSNSSVGRMIVFGIYPIFELMIKFLTPVYKEISKLLKTTDILRTRQNSWNVQERFQMHFIEREVLYYNSNSWDSKWPLISTGSGNGLVPNWRWQIITWIYEDILSVDVLAGISNADCIRYYYRLLFCMMCAYWFKFHGPVLLT